MKNKLPSCCATLLAVIPLPATAATVLSSWTFETNVPSALNNSASSPLLIADAGVFSASSTLQGIHASSNTDWSSPLGNGSPHAYSSNNWGAGDSYQFITRTTGYSSITIAFEQIASDTGPKNFKLLYSLDGSQFFDVSGGNYSVANQSWNSTSKNSNSAFSFNLGGISSLNNQSAVWLRLAQVGTDAVAGGSVTTSGSSRIDNVFVTAAIPEPSAALLGALALPAMLRRKRRSAC